jgi:hypothetical protein
VDCLSPSKTVWRRCMCNVFRLLKPGGSFVVQALRGCEGYRVGEHWFPAANIQSTDFESVLLECGADPATLELAERDLPSHASQGYEGILIASGRTNGRRRAFDKRTSETQGLPCLILDAPNSSSPSRSLDSRRKARSQRAPTARAKLASRPTR